MQGPQGNIKINKIAQVLITCAILFLAHSNSYGQSRLDSVLNYCLGSWKVEAIKYYDGRADGIIRDVVFSDKELQVFESKNGMRKLKYKAETRMDSLDDGTVVMYAYLNKETTSSTFNTYLFHLFPESEESMRVSWFEIYFLRDEEKNNQYIANYRFTRVAD